MAEANALQTYDTIAANSSGVVKRFKIEEGRARKELPFETLRVDA